MQEIINNLIISIASSRAALNELNMKKLEVANIDLDQLRVSTLAELEKASDFLMQSIVEENRMIKRLRELLEAKGR